MTFVKPAGENTTLVTGEVSVERLGEVEAKMVDDRQDQAYSPQTPTRVRACAPSLRRRPGLNEPEHATDRDVRPADHSVRDTRRHHRAAGSRFQRYFATADAAAK